MSVDAQVMASLYQAYLDCLNRQDWQNLGQFVAVDVRHNGRALGLPGYRQMLEGDFEAIPDLFFHAELLAITPPVLACRLTFDCTPVGDAFGVAVNGRHVRFAEHVFYHFKNDRITEVWSLIDQAAIARQIAGTGAA